MRSVRGGDEQAPELLALAKTVSRLRDRVAELEDTAAAAAVLERAKGVLMASGRLPASAAYDELLRRADEHDRTLLEECWAVLGEVHPRGAPPARPAGQPGQEPPGSAFRVRTYLARNGPAPRGREPDEVLAALAADLAGAHTAPAVAACLRRHLRDAVGADAVMVYHRTPGTGLELWAAAGMEPRLTEQWRHVPPVARFAPAEAMATGTPVWLEDPAQDAGRYMVVGAPGRWPCRAWFPVPAGPGATMAVGVLCTGHGPFTEAARELLARAAEVCAAALHTVESGELRDRDPDLDLVRDLFTALPGSAVLLTPVRTDDGAVEDFRIDAAAPDAVDLSGRRGKELVGLRVLESYPTIVDTPLWQGYLDALATGTPYACEPFTYQGIDSGVPGTATYSGQAVPWHGRLVASWVRHDDEARQEHRLAVLQRLGKLGWAHWNLTAGTVVWSDEVYGIFRRDPAAGPMRLEELPLHLMPDDLPALAEEVRRLLGACAPIDHTFRVLTGEGVRHVRIVAEADTDADGAPVEVHGFFQDLTAQRQAELELVESERARVVQQGMLQAERNLARRLQHALLPIAERSMRLAGLDVEVAYLPAEGSGVNVGGDWYSAIELPGGHALFVVGDVAGHGLDAVATMAQLRFTAKGMVVTGSPLTEALHRLNTLLLHTADSQYGTATLILARYDPVEQRLSWVQAGHPPPLLVRDGGSEFLSPPEGILLGATREPRYTEARLRLRGGDHLVFYTDGLVEKPSEHLDAGLQRLAEAARATYGGRGTGGLPAMLSRLMPHGQRRDDTCVLALHLA
ncbi:SpoIIE family protein phosphatase [Streptomyces sp. NPDC012888]|uniref:SpoIIE family protein phosphatase n=1 Tax=Streptomyces sp. NPDC012888 TaxID=3364855 RepID=UPI0036C07E32